MAPQVSSSLAKAEAEVDQLENIETPKASTEAGTQPPLFKWPWWATLLIAAGLLVAFFIFQGLLWDYVLRTAEKLEDQDFDQLKAIADNIQSIVILLVGAIFGVGATQGVAAGATKAAIDNKAATEKANTIANENGAKAQSNAARAARLEEATKSLATALVTYREKRLADDTGHVTDRQALLLNLNQGTASTGEVLSYDPELDEMAESAQRILRRLR